MAKREWISAEHRIFKMPNGRIYARVSVPGIGRKEFPLPVTARTLKQQISAKERAVAAMLRANEPTPKTLVRVEDLAREIIRLKEGRAKATWVSADLQFRKHILPWANEHEPYMSQWTDGTVEEYLQAQALLNPKRKLFNDVKHLRMLSRMAHRRGIIPRPLEIRNPDPPRAAGRRVSHEEVARLLESASEELTGQILLAVTMGMRKSEILQLSWDRVVLEGQTTITLRPQDTKIRRGRVMGISHRAKQWLKWARSHEPAISSPYVFPSRFSPLKPTLSNKTAWAACKRRAKVKCRFHDLRHSFLSVALLERGLNPLHVAVYAGVSLQEIQRTYLHPSVEDTRVVAAAWFPHNSPISSEAVRGKPGVNAGNGDLARKGDE